MLQKHLKLQLVFVSVPKLTVLDWVAITTLNLPFPKTLSTNYFLHLKVTNEFYSSKIWIKWHLRNVKVQFVNGLIKSLFIWYQYNIQKVHLYQCVFTKKKKKKIHKLLSAELQISHCFHDMFDVCNSWNSLEYKP